MRCVQLAKYDFLSSLFVCNKINIIWCWWWYTRRWRAMMITHIFAHCSIFGFLCRICCCCCYAVLEKAGASGHMQAHELLLLLLLCMLSFFRFNELIICLIQALIFVFYSRSIFFLPLRSPPLPLLPLSLSLADELRRKFLLCSAFADLHSHFTRIFVMKYCWLNMKSTGWKRIAAQIIIIERNGFK